MFFLVFRNTISENTYPMVPKSLTPQPRRPLLGRLKATFKLLFMAPPEREKIHSMYNQLRQEYVLDMARHHFHKREDDPAPLYGMELLDIGCGANPINTFMALSGANVTAVDPNAKALEEAQLQAEAYGLNINFINGRVESLLPSGKTYDIILCLDVLEYIENLDRFLWCLRQMLKPNGVLIFSAINKKPKSWFVHIFLSEILLNRISGRGRSYKRFYTPPKLRSLLLTQKLAVTTIQGLVFDEQTSCWYVCHRPDTRFLSTAKPV